MGELKVGDRVPSFTLPDQDNHPFHLDEALAKGPVVLFFYPKDFTPGCTAEACSFRDASSEFIDAGATVCGVSSDDVASHRRFADEHKLVYPLLADVGGEVRKLLSVPRGMLGFMDGRVTYVIDQKGILRHKFDAMLRATKHVDEALSTVRSLVKGSA